ncbi:MAG TPA: HD domain-containing phosphohydrolase, partial [Acidobacteriota bacterium]|nr:HD domain-containing phosphohydrolase [Acidobacteriota bacterium]
WDGNGYPDGLKGEEIPLGARILTIADAFDAIRYSRPYKLSMETDEALETLRAQSGIFFDPNLVKLLEEHITDLEKAAAQEADRMPELSFRKKFETVNEVLSTTAAFKESVRDIPAELIQLSELCSSLMGYLSVREILPLLFHRLKRIVPFDSCIVYELESDTRLVGVYADGKHADALLGRRINMGIGISGWVAAYRRPILNTNPSLDFSGLQGDYASLADALVVPVIHGDESVGVIALYAEEHGLYSRKHMDALQIFAKLLAPNIRTSDTSGVSEADDCIDQETGLYRVSYLSTVGQQLISASEHDPAPISLIYLEIRNLRKISQIYGRAVAGTLLRKIADCMKLELRETDILVRYGNLGFAALLPGVGDEQASSCGRRLTDRIRNHARIPGQEITLDCATGISIYPKDGTTILTLIQSAQASSMSVPVQHHFAADRNIVDFPPRF